MMRKWIRLTSVVAFSSQLALAQMVSPTDLNTNSGAEYFVGKETGKPLITVNLLNGVTRPGVYHVPAQTTLPQLVAYAGGSVAHADPAEIRIRRFEREKSLFMRHDMNAIINQNEPFPVMMDKDVVQFRERATLDTTLRWVGFFSGLAAIALSVSTVHNQNK